MSNFKGWEIIIILALLLLLFGDDEDDREPRSDPAERSDVRPAPRVLPGTVEDRDQGTPQATEQQTER